MEVYICINTYVYDAYTNLSINEIEKLNNCYINYYIDNKLILIYSNNFNKYFHEILYYFKSNKIYINNSISNQNIFKLFIINNQINQINAFNMNTEIKLSYIELIKLYLDYKVLLDTKDFIRNKLLSSLNDNELEKLICKFNIKFNYDLLIENLMKNHLFVDHNNNYFSILKCFNLDELKLILFHIFSYVIDIDLVKDTVDIIEIKGSELIFCKKKVLYEHHNFILNNMMLKKYAFTSTENYINIKYFNKNYQNIIDNSKNHKLFNTLHSIIKK